MPTQINVAIKLSKIRTNKRKLLNRDSAQQFELGNQRTELSKIQNRNQPSHLENSKMNSVKNKTKTMIKTKQNRTLVYVNQ